MDNLDLTQILRNCPTGTKLYSTLFGEVTFVGINKYGYITVEWNGVDRHFFDKEGKFYASEDAECLLFPSRSNRDWSTLKVQQPKAKQPQEFKPFQKVLVRDSDRQQWCPQIYSFYADDSTFPHVCMGSRFKYCVSYEGNESLLGTSNDPE